jgi:hypothetical protein
VDYANKAIVNIRGGSNSGKFALQFSYLVSFGKIIIATNVRSDGGQWIHAFGTTNIIDREAVDIEDQIYTIVSNGLLYAVDTVSSAYSGGVSQ